MDKQHRAYRHEADKLPIACNINPIDIMDRLRVIGTNALINKYSISMVIADVEKEFTKRELAYMYVWNSLNSRIVKQKIDMTNIHSYIQ